MLDLRTTSVGRGGRLIKKQVNSGLFKRINFCSNRSHAIVYTMKVLFLIVATLLAAANGQFFGAPASISKPFTNAAGNVAGQIRDNAPNVSVEGLVPDVNLRGVIPKEVLEKAWDGFKILYNKSYANAQEELKRKEIFLENFVSISSINDIFSSGLSTFGLKLNAFADLLLDEFNRLFNGFRGGNRKVHDSSLEASTFKADEAGQIPESIDWRARGGVSPVKYQGQCASCHAFSAAGAIEGHLFRKTGVLKELSPQNLLDCVPEKYQSFHCAGGGYVDEDLKYVGENPGIALESAYPYQGVDGKCKFDRKASAANVTGYVEIPEGDEKALAVAVATKGPVSVGVDASHKSFQFYSEGVYFEKDCKNRGENINHAMLVVGYGVEKDGRKYWIVKNSYGADWGVDGYVKIAKDEANHCGIATSAVYPVV